MEISEDKVNDVKIVALEGRLDTSNYTELQAELLDIIQSGETKLLLDLEKLDYISSAGLRVMLTIAKKLKALQGVIALAAMNELTREVFEISGFIRLFKVYENREAALKEIAEVAEPG